MMKRWWIGALIVCVAILGFSLWKMRPKAEKWREYAVEQAPFRVKFTSMGTITPKNKIVVSAPLNGRIDKVLVEEGAVVKKGQVMAWISSTDRVALMDAVQSGEAESSWAEMYKPAPIRAPVNGRVILKSVVQGQTVAPETSLFELSDILIVVSKVDEADIGKVRLNQEADVRVDAFPDETVKTRVARVGEQSTLVNNVTSYDVFLEPEAPFATKYRSGMSVGVEYVVRIADSALTLPTWISEGRQKTEIELRVKSPQGTVENRTITLGDSNGEAVEILSGLSAGDRVLYRPMDFTAPDTKSSPFGISGPRRRR